MKRMILWVLPLFISSVCKAEDITIRYKGTTAKVEQKVKDSIQVHVYGANVEIESQFKSRKLTLKLTGKSDDGQLVLKTAGKAEVKLDNLTLTSQEGAPLWLKNKKKVEVKAVKGTEKSVGVLSMPGVRWARLRKDWTAICHRSLLKAAPSSPWVAASARHRLCLPTRQPSSRRSFFAV